MNRKIVIAGAICLVGMGFVVAIFPRQSLLSGVGLLLEAGLLLFVTWQAWLARGGVGVRMLLIVISIAAASAIFSFLDSVASGKVDFTPAFIFQNFLSHLVIAGLFITGVFVIDRGIAAIQLHNRRTQSPSDH